MKSYPFYIELNLNLDKIKDFLETLLFGFLAAIFDKATLLSVSVCIYILTDHIYNLRDRYIVNLMSKKESIKEI